MVAINKCDLPSADPDRVRRQMQENGLSPEAWGGDTIAIEVSAQTGQGLDDLVARAVPGHDPDVGAAEAWDGLGMIARTRGDLGAARTYHDRALTVFAASGQRRREASTRHHLAAVARTILETGYECETDAIPGTTLVYDGVSTQGEVDSARLTGLTGHPLFALGDSITWIGLLYFFNII